jgi:hypothetical protein
VLEQSQHALVKLLWHEQARQRASEKSPIDNGVSLDAAVNGGDESEMVVFICELKLNRQSKWN